MAHKIVKCKKPDTIVEELILSAEVDFVITMIGEGAAEKLNMVPLSDDTMCCRIGDVAQDIHDQLMIMK